MLGEAIGDLLPLAFAVALSPVPIVAAIAILAGPRGRTAGPAFALGWVAGLVGVSVLVVLVLGAPSESDTESGVGWFKLAVGALFLVMAVRQWRKRPTDGESPQMPKWMATVDSLSPLRSALLGAGFSAANPKNLALTLAAGASIAQTGLDTAGATAAIAVYVVLASVTIAGPALFHLLDAEQAQRPLAAVRRFMATNNAVIMMVILLLIGAKLLGDGLALI